MGNNIEVASDDEVHREAARLVAAGDCDAAFQLLTDLSERQSRELISPHPALGSTLAELALIAFAQGYSGKAQPLAERALDILRGSLGPRNPTLAHRMSEFIEAAEKAGDVACAANFRQRIGQIGAMPVANAISALDADALHMFGNNLAMRGEFEEAERHLREAIRLWRSRQAGRSELAETLSDLGEVLRRTGRFDAAEPVEAEAYVIVMEDDTPSLTRAKVLSNYGLLSNKRGNFSKAHQLYEQAIALYRADNPASWHLGIAVFNKGVLFEEMADLTTAERFYVEAADILKRSVGENHISFSLVANNLGNLYRLTGRLAAAENLLRRAVDVRRYHLSDQHPWLAVSLINLGLALTASGRPSDAARAFKQAIDILEARKLPGIDLQYAYQALAVARSLERDWASADALLQKAIALQEATLGPSSAVLSHMLSNLAFARAARGRPQEAISLMERVAAIEDAMLISVASVLSDQQRIGLLAHLSSHLTQVLAIVRCFFAASPEHVSMAFRHVLTRKAISAEVMGAQRDAILAGNNQETQALVQRLSEISRKIGQLASNGPGSNGLHSHDQMLADLQRAREQIEGQIAPQVPEVALRRRLMSADVRELAAALPPNSMLIEFVKSEAISFQSLEIPEPDYCMFILISGDPSSLQLVQLGAASHVDDLVAKVRARIVKSGRSFFARFGRPTFQEAGWELSRVIVDPLRPFLDKCSRIFISPDGMLNMLPFGVLPLDESRLMLDCCEISYLASGRDLLRFGQRKCEATPAIVLADPNFDLAHTGAPRKDRVDPTAPRFHRLRGTREEGVRVAALLGVKPWLGNDALEGRLKQISSPQILHIATHGFFYPEAAPDEATLHGEADLKRLAEHLTATTITDNPLLRSGLALAAANWRFHGVTPPEEAEDGLLSAFDVTGMNLTGTRLVVLSACVTGLGHIHPTEGTMGLRRSFAVAGAEALLVSLWNVPDRATKTLMLKFYRALGRAMTPGIALRQAQTQMRRWNRNPYFWGAFVCYGNVSHPLASG